jgi:hypothetical protein
VDGRLPLGSLAAELKGAPNRRVRGVTKGCFLTRRAAQTTLRRPADAGDPMQPS